MKNVDRRRFLKSAAVTTAGLGCVISTRLQAMEPIKRSGQARLALSLAAYSFREFFKPPNAKLDMLKFVDYCADQGCEGAEVTSYYFPNPLTDDYLLKLKRHAFLRGIALSGTAVGNNFALPKGEALTQQIESVKKWIDHAALMGAPHIRVFAGPQPKGLSPEAARKNCIEAMEECCDYAGKKGVVLGLENHGGIVAEGADLLEIVRAVKSDWFGINLDTGNFHSEDPYAEMAACAPYAVNVQIKVEVRPKGAAKAEPMDLERGIRILREANYQGYVALEYEAREDPWTAVPEWLAKMKQAMAKA